MASKPRALREDRAGLYDRDFYAWTQEQAGLLRRARAERINTELDLENLAEEIECLLGKEQAHALRLEDNPGLGPHRQRLFEQAYRLARREAARQTSLPLKTFPEICPFALDDASRDGFLPK